MYELKTYPEKEQFYKENKRVGFCGDESLSEIGDIWIMELYQNKSNGHYSLFITTDSDESWLIYDFDKRAKVTKSEV